MTVALVTGAAGFCGRHLIRRLRREAGIRVHGVDIRDECPDDLVLDDYASADLCDGSRVSGMLRDVQPDLIFHLAGVSHGPPSNIYNVNLSCGIQLLEAIRNHSPHARTLIVGTAAEYGRQLPEAMPLHEDQPCHPVGEYARSKYALTSAAIDYAKRFDLKVVVARPFNVIGPGVPAHLVVGALLDRIKRVSKNMDAAEISVGNLDSERDFVDVGDVVDSYVKMLQGEYWGEVFNICSGKPIAISWIVESLLAFSDQPIRVRQDPSLMQRAEIKAIYGCWEKANKAFSFEPNTNLKGVLREAWQHELEKE